MARRIASLSFVVSFALVACGEPADEMMDSGMEAGDADGTSGGEGAEGESGDGDAGDGDTTGAGTGGGCEIVPVAADQVVMIGDSYLAVTSVAQNI
jgi:hypothetical protein